MEGKKLQLITIGGSHGTLLCMFNSIKMKGFSASKSGRLGKGIYFWKECAYWKELAIAWVKQEYERTYESRNPGVVLFCEIETEENTYINIEQDEIRNKILKHIKKRNIPMNEKLYSQAHDLIIKEMEKRHGVKYKVIEGTVPPPKNDFFPNGNSYPTRWVGFPVCLSVRNDTCIKILNTIEFTI